MLAPLAAGKGPRENGKRDELDDDDRGEPHPASQQGAVLNRNPAQERRERQGRRHSDEPRFDN
jgi:hypothetical protein